jgi:hypothetical protein
MAGTFATRTTATTPDYTSVLSARRETVMLTEKQEALLRQRLKVLLAHEYVTDLDGTCQICGNKKDAVTHPKELQPTGDLPAKS